MIDSRRYSGYFPDLSPYQTDGKVVIPDVLTIGWLSNEMFFPIGDSPKDFTDKLKRLIISLSSSKTDVVMGRWRGESNCPLCRISSREIEKTIPGTGEAEIWIPSIPRQGTYYSSSTWIVHYILDHGYLPPAEYINSVMFFDNEKEFKADMIAFELERKYRVICGKEPYSQEYIDLVYRLFREGKW